MKLNSTTFCLFAFAIFAASFNLSAEGKKSADKNLTNSERAKEILDKARKSKISTVSTKVTRTSKETIENICWRKFNPDGTILTKLQVTWRNSKGKITYKSTRIVKSDGTAWQIIGDIAIKSEESKPPINFSKKTSKPKYKLSEINYKSIPCYKITIINDTASLNDNPIALEVFTIGKDNLFIYSTNYYTKDGNLLVSIAYESIKKMEGVGEEFFNIPSNCRIYIAKTGAEYAKLNALAGDKLRIQLGSDNGMKKYYEKKYGTSDIDEIIKMTTE